MRAGEQFGSTAGHRNDDEETRCGEQALGGERALLELCFDDLAFSKTAAQYLYRLHRFNANQDRAAGADTFFRCYSDHIPNG